MRTPHTLSARTLLLSSYWELGRRFEAPRWHFADPIHTAFVVEEDASAKRGWFGHYPEFRVIPIGMRLWAVAIGSIMDTATEDEAFRVESALIAVPFGLRVELPLIAAALREVIPSGGDFRWGLVFSQHNGVLAIPRCETPLGRALAMRVAPIIAPYETCGPIPNARNASDIIRVPVHYQVPFGPVFTEIIIDVLRGF